MNVFVVRPFGVKSAIDGLGREVSIDFEHVHAALIGPALAAAELEGGTTAEIVRAGNIREDMFQSLLTADLVVADLSVHNANVFYELGIRHALRERRTVLMRCGVQDVPFDLETDRYVTYDQAHPERSVGALEAVIRQTVRSEVVDSPVHRLLPGLRVSDPEEFQVVPAAFAEAVESAGLGGRLGDLALYAHEAEGRPWSRKALRSIGRTLVDLEAYEPARQVWERVREWGPDDIEANVKLGTIYQRLGDLGRSDQALQRVLSVERTDRRARAEAWALIGSNARTMWREEWATLSGDPARARALASPHLRQALDAYRRGYEEDLNHFYAGINLLACLVVMRELARTQPGLWQDDFDTAEEAERAFARLDTECDAVSAAVQLSIGAAEHKAEAQGVRDVWLEITRADLAFLRGDTPGRVARAYERALSGAPAFFADPARRQLVGFAGLNVHRETARAALEVFNSHGRHLADARKAPVAPRVLLFAGHRIDAPGRPVPRFPATAEEAVRAAIRRAIKAELERSDASLVGIAGGASGGDILFHEVCAELGLDTWLYLALPARSYVAGSVQDAGADWVARFETLYEEHARRGAIRILQEDSLPPWLSGEDYDGIWPRNNLWLLCSALAFGSGKATLIALWNGEEGDGPGGAADMVRLARSRGARTVVVDPAAAVTASMASPEK